ncbi:MAG: DNA polymerase III subunit epsilon [Acidiferrobacterales bacterium]
MRQIVLDTETTGLDPAEGHRIIEIGCVELVNRRPTGNNYHQYIQPDREIDEGALDIHGITNESLADKPRFPDVARDFLEYTKGAQLVIHNAPFDVGFLNHEFTLAEEESKTSSISIRVEEHCTIEDTLELARKLHPGQKNDLDSLCKRYNIDNSQRTLHGALLDAEILADVYLAMTGGQSGLFEEQRGTATERAIDHEVRRLDPDRPPLLVVQASEEEHLAHLDWLDYLEQQSEGRCIWKRLGEHD